MYLDANALIYSVEKVSKYWPLLEVLWADSAARTIRVIGSELLILEALVGPLQAGDTTLVDLFDAVFRSQELTLVPITLATLRRAAEIRAAHRIKTPDAIHAATAIESACSHFLTNDRGIRRISNLNVVVLDDVLEV